METEKTRWWMPKHPLRRRFWIVNLAITAIYFALMKGLELAGQDSDHVFVMSGYMMTMFSHCVWYYIRMMYFGGSKDKESIQ